MANRRTTPAPSVVVVEEQQLDLVRVEKNLHSLGFFASTASKEVSRTIVQIIRRPDGQKIQAKAVIEGIPSLGLPTTADRDKYMAFMKIALDQREAQGQIANPVRFTGADMIKLLRLRKGGFHYDEINDWCKRMVATTIMSESSIFLADRRQYVSDTFHVFDRVVLVGEELADGTRSEFYQVYLSQWQINNLNQGYLLPLDFNAYLELRRDIAKAIFGHLSVWFYASRGQPVIKRYQDLCRLLHIRAYPHISKARSVLEPSLRELTEIGYLSEWELTRSSTGEFKLYLAPGKRLLSLPNFAHLVNKPLDEPLNTNRPAWFSTLLERGVAERKALQLLFDIPPEQPVSDQIAYVDHLIRQDQRTRSKIANPAGFYIWAIEQNLAVPPSFHSSRQPGGDPTSPGPEANEAAQTAHLRQLYEQHCEEQIRQALERDYPAERLEQALSEQIRILRREQAEWFNRVPAATRHDIALCRLRSQIRSTLNLPAFEDWARRQTQLRLL